MVKHQEEFKNQMISELRSLRSEGAPECFEVFNNPELIMDSTLNLWGRWAAHAETMTEDYGISYEQAVRICAINEDLGLAICYAENSDSNEAMEIVPYLCFLTEEASELIDQVREKLPEDLAVKATEYLQLQSILTSMYKHILSKGLAARRTLSLLHGGKGLIDLSRREGMELPDATCLDSMEILEAFDCSADCMNCRRDPERCFVRRLKAGMNASAREEACPV